MTVFIDDTMRKTNDPVFTVSEVSRPALELRQKTNQRQPASFFAVPRLPVFGGELRLGQEGFGDRLHGHEQPSVPLLDQLLTQHVSDRTACNHGGGLKEVQMWRKCVCVSASLNTLMEFKFSFVFFNYKRTSGNAGFH